MHIKNCAYVQIYKIINLKWICIQFARILTQQIFFSIIIEKKNLILNVYK